MGRKCRGWPTDPQGPGHAEAAYKTRPSAPCAGRRADHARGPKAAFEPVEWAEVVTRLRSDLKQAGRLAVAVSPFLTVEEAWMLCGIARSIDPEAFLAPGFVPVTGDDETFPGGFTIRGEKCPNRRGVEGVLAQFNAGGRSWGDLLAHVAAGQADAAWITGGYPTPWLDDVTAGNMRRGNCLRIGAFTSVARPTG